MGLYLWGLRLYLGFVCGRGCSLRAKGTLIALGVHSSVMLAKRLRYKSTTLDPSIPRNEVL